MPLPARIAVCSVLIGLSAGCLIGWLVASEPPASLFGQWAAGIGWFMCVTGGFVIALWKPAPPRGFPVKPRQPSKRA